MTRTYKPIGDGVLLRKLKMEDHTKGGILLPDMAQGDILKGQVIEVGDGLPDIPMFVEPGDVVLYFVKRELMIDDYVLVSQRDVYVIVEDDEDNESEITCPGDMIMGVNPIINVGPDGVTV
jgi:chaperonin GroES